MYDHGNESAAQVTSFTPIAPHLRTELAMQEFFAIYQQGIPVAAMAAGMTKQQSYNSCGCEVEKQRHDGTTRLAQGRVFTETDARAAAKCFKKWIDATIEDVLAA
jgi:hypothetical protein